MSDNENINYQDFEEFNSYIDEEGFSSIEEGLVSIYGNRFKPSQVLFMMDEIAYKEAYEEYLNNLFEDNKNTIFSEFPSHIAVNFRKLYNGNPYMEARERLGHLIDCSESVINFIFYLAICELRHHRVNISYLKYRDSDDVLNPIYKNLKVNDFFDNKSKLKLRMLQALVENNVLKNNNCYCNQISLNVLEVLIELDYLKTEIICSGTLSNEQYDSKFQQGYDKLNSIIPEIMFLKDCKILKLIECKSGKAFCTVYEGDSSVQKTVDFKLDRTFSSEFIESEDTLLFAKLDNEYIKMTPYLHFKTESEGHDSIICTFKNLCEENYIFEHSKTKSEIQFKELKEIFDMEKKYIESMVNLLEKETIIQDEDSEEELKRKIEEIKSSHKKFLLFTEGKTDVVHIDNAWKKIKSTEPPFEIHPINGADKLKDFLLAYPPEKFKQVVIGLFDYDEKGLQVVKKLGTSFKTEISQYTKKYCVKDDNRNCYAILLPHKDEKFKLLENCPIEFLYKKELLEEYKFIKKRSIHKINSIEYVKDNGYINKESYEKLEDLYYFELDESSYSKNDFAQLIKKRTDLSKEDFEEFQLLFDEIETIIKLHENE